MDTRHPSDRTEDAPPHLLHALPYPVALVCAADGCIVMANPLFWAAFGLPAKAHPDGPLENPESASPDPVNRGAAADAVRIHRLDDGAVRIETAQGTRSPVAAQVQPMRHSGEACWLVTTPADAGRRPSGDDAAEEARRYRGLVENLNDVLYTTDRNAMVTYVSPNISQLAGYSPEEVIGRSFVEFVHPDDLSGRIEQFLKILGGATQATEYRLLTKSGEVRWARTSARPIRSDGQVVGVQGILVDITDRKAIEAALIRSEEKYRVLVQHAKDAIFVIQGDHITFMNPVASETLGYPLERIAHRPFIEFVHPDDREMILDRYARRMRGEPLSDRVAFRIVDRTGDVRDVDLNAVLITWENKPAVLNFLRDVTLQKKMEDQLRNSQKMEALGTLASGIAHNFNNLLMGIHGNVSLSLMRMDPAAESRRHLEKIGRLVESGSKLTNQLLAYARGGSCEIGTMDVNRLVRDVAETLTATRKQMRIRQRLDEAVPCIRADRGQIEQVLLNLLLNAADAMPEGGEVLVEASGLNRGDIEAGTDLAGNRDYVLLAVTDRGTGIPKEILNRVFEPFFTTKGLGSGTGLGLSSAYGIVRNHGGTITVESEVGRGTTFRVYLPADQEASREPEAAVEEAEPVAGRGTLLLVDDEPPVIDSSAELLELQGFTVLKAYNGSTALELFRANWQTIDLVVLDLILPEISGKDLYQHFRVIDPQVRVLLSSGFSMAGQAEELMAAGCRGFIQKPYRINDLSSQIMGILAA